MKRRSIVGLLSDGLGLTVTAIAGYLGLLTVAAWDARRRTGPASAGPVRHRFLVLIPAHNEEKLIGETLDSLWGIDYPRELFAVHVIADNCSDRTAEIARSHHVHVHERRDVERLGKGASLQWLFERLDRHDDGYDAVLFIDADTVVSRNILRAADALIAGGATVIQFHYAVRDEESSPLIAFRSAALAARNYLRPLGRTHIGGTAGLFGNGMVFRGDVLRSVAWTSHLTEDAELQLNLLDRGIKVKFAPTGRVEAEMPNTLEAAQSQHARWERGRIELAGRFVPDLFRQVIAGGPAGRVAALDSAVDLLIPPFSVIVAANVVWSAVALAGCVVTPSRRWRRSLLLSSGTAAVHTLYVLSALRMVDAPAAVYRSLLGSPRLVVWKVALWSGALLRPSSIGWMRTSRNVN